MATTNPLISEERLQKYILPLKIEPSPTASCRIARLSAESGDHLDLGISVSESDDSTVVAFTVTGSVGELAVSETVDQVTFDLSLSCCGFFETIKTTGYL